MFDKLAQTLVSMMFYYSYQNGR